MPNPGCLSGLTSGTAQPGSDPHGRGRNLHGANAKCHSADPRLWGRCSWAKGHNLSWGARSEPMGLAGREN